MRPLSALLVLLAFATGGAAQDHPLAFVDVALVPLDSARVVEHQTVVVRAGRIERVGSADEVAVPADAQRVDGRGRFLMPGLADMHIHLTPPETDQLFATDNRAAMALLLAHGVTTARVMAGSPGLLAFRDSVARGDVLGPSLTVASPLVDGRGQYEGGDTFGDEAGRYVTETPEAAQAVVREIGEAGYDYVKVYSSLPRAAYRAVLDEAEAVGIPVVGHVPWTVGLARVLTDPRQASVEHVSAFNGLAEASDSPLRDSTAWWWRGFGTPAYAHPERIAVVAEIAAASRMWFVPTLFTSEYYTVPQAQTLVRLDDPAFARYTLPVQRARWRAYAEGLGAYLDRLGVDMAAWRPYGLAVARALHDADARLLAGSDDSVLGVHGAALHDELALWAEAGLTPFEALRLATVNAHAFLREHGRGGGTGTLREGEPADLVFLRANPLADIAHARQIEGVVVRGRYLDRARLDGLLSDAERAYAQPPRP